MDDSKKNTLLDFLEYFRKNGISHDAKRGLKHVLNFQDFIGHCTPSELADVEAGMTVDVRRTFFWVCMSCMDMDMAMNIFKWTFAQRTVTEQTDIEFERVREEISELDARKAQFQLCRKSYWKRLNKVRNECEWYKVQIHRLEDFLSLQCDETRALKAELAQTRLDAEKFRSMRELLMEK